MDSVAALHDGVPAQQSDISDPAVRLFMQTVRDCFVLGSSTADRTRILSSMRELPGDLQAAWTELIKTKLARWDFNRFDHSLGHDCRGLDSALLQISEDSGSKTCLTCRSEHVHWSQLDRCGESHRLQEIRSRNHIRRGTPREDIYDAYLSQMASISEFAVVVDRYAGQRLIKHGNSSGLAWLASRLVADGVSRVALITGTRRGCQLNDISAAATALGDPDLRDALRIGTAPDRDFSRYAHDRFVMLQSGSVARSATFGKGVEIFESPRLLQTSAVGLGRGLPVTTLADDLGVRIEPLLS